MLSDLRCLSSKNKKILREIPHLSLKNAYNELSIILNKKFRPEIHRTSNEFYLYSKLSKEIKFKIMHSVWIGNRNIDFFIPKVKLSNHSGLVIEVDGEVHLKEFKMKKDFAKFNQLEKLNLEVYRLMNGEINHPITIELISKIKKSYSSDTRSFNRLMRRIYIFTIVSNKKIIQDDPFVSSHLKNILLNLSEIFSNEINR